MQHGLVSWKKGVHGYSNAGRVVSVGKGVKDFAVVMRELHATGYAGPIVSEVPPETATLEETAKAMRQIALL